MYSRGSSAGSAHGHVALVLGVDPVEFEQVLRGSVDVGRVVVELPGEVSAQVVARGLDRLFGGQRAFTLGQLAHHPLRLGG